MHIYAKSKLTNNIYDKINKGAAGIEIHLEDDFIDDIDYWDEKLVNDAPIVAVHAPLIKKNDTNIEVMSNRKVLVKTCDFARKISKVKGYPIMVICHLGTEPETLKQLGIYESLVFFMRDLANTYECLTFAVENVPPFANDAASHIAFRAVEYDSAPRFVRDVGHERVGTCLDTCHAIMTIRLLKNTAEYLKHDESTFDNAPLNMGLAAFFEANLDVVKWIHLAYSKSHGLYEDHGLPFTDEDKDSLQTIVSMYQTYHYDCPITIEVREQDYTDAVNYITTHRTLTQVLNQE